MNGKEILLWSIMGKLVGQIVSWSMSHHFPYWEKQNSCLLLWSYYKIKYKESSSLTAETLTNYDLYVEAILLNSLINETVWNNKQTKSHVTYVIGNSFPRENTHSTKQVLKKRLKINIVRVKEEGEIKNIHWIQSSFQLADLLTKKNVNPETISTVSPLKSWKRHNLWFFLVISMTGETSQGINNDLSLKGAKAYLVCKNTSSKESG